MSQTPLFNNPIWQAVQADWQALQLLAEEAMLFEKWDLLRVYLDRQINQLQRLVLQQSLSPEAQNTVAELMQLRFEQAMSQQKKQQIRQVYQLESQAHRGPFSRYQALGDLERAMLMEQHAQELSQTPRSIRQSVLHDANFELMESFARRQTREQRGQQWQQGLNLLVLLSWTEAPAQQALEQLMLEITKFSDTSEVQALALRSLKSSRHLQVQCAAIRLLAGDYPPWDELIKLIESPHTPSRVLQELLNIPPPYPEALGQVLLELLKRPSLEDGQMRQGELRRQALALFPKAAGLEEGILLLQVFQQARNWHVLTRLMAVRVLTQFGHYVGFDESVALLQQAAREDDIPLLEAATETLVALKKPEACSFLLAVLNGQYRQETAYERYRQAFKAEIQSQYPFLKRALEKLGQKVIEDPVSGQWHTLGQ